METVRHTRTNDVGISTLNIRASLSVSICRTHITSIVAESDVKALPDSIRESVVNDSRERHGKIEIYVFSSFSIKKLPCRRGVRFSRQTMQETDLSFHSGQSAMPQQIG